MHNWRIIIDEKGKPEENMAKDEAILLNVIAGSSLPTIRFYDWEPATVSCGYNQKSDTEVDFSRLEQKGYGFVRRPTGGRLVLHKNEVTYSVIAPIEGVLSGNLTNSYSSISRALAKGLNLLGIEVELEKGSLSPQHQRSENNPCFTSSSKFELKFNGKKIVGSAQLRKNNAILQHGAILLNTDQSEIAELIPGISDEDRVRLKKFLVRKSTAINKHFKQPKKFNEVVEKLIEGFKISWNEYKFSISDYSDQEIELAKELASEKYASPKWNMK